MKFCRAHLFHRKQEIIENYVSIKLFYPLLFYYVNKQNKLDLTILFNTLDST